MTRAGLDWSLPSGRRLSGTTRSDIQGAHGQPPAPRRRSAALQIGREAHGPGTEGRSVGRPALPIIYPMPGQPGPVTPEAARAAVAAEERALKPGASDPAADPRRPHRPATHLPAHRFGIAGSRHQRQGGQVTEDVDRVGGAGGLLGQDACQPALGPRGVRGRITRAFGVDRAIALGSEPQTCRTRRSGAARRSISLPKSRAGCGPWGWSAWRMAARPDPAHARTWLYSAPARCRRLVLVA